MMLQSWLRLCLLGAAQAGFILGDPGAQSEDVTALLQSHFHAVATRSATTKARQSSFSGGPQVGWDATLRKYVQEVQDDKECQDLVTTLLAYARQQVEENLPRMRANLKAIGLDVVDLLWYGEGYSQAACGGQYEVLTLLEKEGLLKVGKVVGTSGGASSTILALADADLSSRTVLKYTMVYSRWSSNSAGSAQQHWRATPMWNAIYDEAVQSDAAFARIKARACIVSSCSRAKNVALYNFTSRRQVAQAGFASEDDTVGGHLLGTEIQGTRQDIGRCADGGRLAHLPNRSAALLFYNSLYNHSQSVDMAAIEQLFRQGVAETIQLLTRSNLTLDSNERGRGGMMVVRPGPTGRVTAKDFGVVTRRWKMDRHTNPGMVFYDIGAGRQFEEQDEAVAGEDKEKETDTQAAEVVAAGVQ